MYINKTMLTVGLGLWIYLLFQVPAAGYLSVPAGFLIYRATTQALSSKDIRQESGHKIPKGLKFIPWWFKTRVICQRKTLIKALVAEKQGRKRKYTLAAGSLGWRFFQGLQYKDFTLPPELAKCSKPELALLMKELGVFEDASLIEAFFSPYGVLLLKDNEQPLSAQEISAIEELSRVTVDLLGQSASNVKSIKIVGGWMISRLLEQNKDLGLEYLTASRYPMIEAYVLILTGAELEDEDVVRILLEVESYPPNVQETFRTLLRDARGSVLKEAEISGILSVSCALEELETELKGSSEDVLGAA